MEIYNESGASVCWHVFTYHMSHLMKAKGTLDRFYERDCLYYSYFMFLFVFPPSFPLMSVFGALHFFHSFNSSYFCLLTCFFISVFIPFVLCVAFFFSVCLSFFLSFFLSFSRSLFLSSCLFVYISYFLLFVCLSLFLSFVPPPFVLRLFQQNITKKAIYPCCQYHRTWTTIILWVSVIKRH